jgi:subtilisin family serine protease
MKYIIDFVNELSLSEVDQYLSDNNITKIKQFGSFGHVFLVESEVEITTNDKILYVIRDDNQSISLLSVDINLVDRGIPTSFGTEELQSWWKVASIDEVDFDNEVQNKVIRGSNSTVYIIDSGITIDHPEFASSNITLLHSFNDNFIDNKGHGTALSSLIAGSTCSLSNPKLKIVKIFDTTQPTLQSDLVAALDAIYADYISNGRKGSVINMSWSIPNNTYINSKIQYLINEGIFVVASAGNSGQSIGDVTPASIPDVLTIGSYGQNLTPSKFSNYTGESSISYTANDVNYGALDGWAPGEYIYTANSLSNGYSYIVGTSASAAIATAAFAYNLDTILQDNGNVHDNLIAIAKNRLDYFNTNTLSRPGVLDLTEVAYKDSANKIATFRTSPSKGALKQRLVAKAGTTRTNYMFSPVLIEKVSYESIPDFITINDRGFITIAHPDITELSKVLPDMEFNLLYRDGSVGLCIVTVVLWNQDYDSINDLAARNPEDETLQYMLAVGPGQCTGFPFYCAEYGCNDYSGGAVACFGGGKTFPLAYCICS